MNKNDNKIKKNIKIKRERNRKQKKILMHWYDDVVIAIYITNRS